MRTIHHIHKDNRKIKIFTLITIVIITIMIIEFLMHLHAALKYGVTNTVVCYKQKPTSTFVLIFRF